MDSLFELANCEKFGDYIIAKSDLAEGKIILDEEPLLTLHANCENPGYSCVGCFRILPTDSLRCSQCQFPICGPLCSKEKFHSKLECQLFGDKGVLPSTDAYRALKFVRVFASMEKFPKVYQKFQGLASGMSPALENHSFLMNAECTSVLKFLTEKCHMSVTLSEVTRVWAAVNINSFVIQDAEFRGNVVFENASKFSHGCFPSLDWFLINEETDDGTQYKLRMICARNVQKGEILCITYKAKGLNYGTGLRRKMFEKNLPFECACSRCVDATEEGTFFSSFKCSTCKRGNLLPEDPLSSFTCSWKCSECSADMEGGDIQKETELIENHIKDSMVGDFTDLHQEMLDQFIDHYTGNPLHPNHFLIFNATFRWLMKSDFSATLMPDTKESAKVFEKIMSRFYSCLNLANKCSNTFDIAFLEMVMAKVVSAFAFKSKSMITVNASNNPRQNLQYSKRLLKHLTRSRLWMQKQPDYFYLDDTKVLDELYNQWTRRCEAYRQDLLSLEMEMEDNAFLELRSIFE